MRCNEMLFACSCITLEKDEDVFVKKARICLFVLPFRPFVRPSVRLSAECSFEVDFILRLERKQVPFYMRSESEVKKHQQ